MPKEAKASLGKARQVVHLTGKVNFPYSRLAGGLALQDRRKRFNQRFLKRFFLRSAPDFSAFSSSRFAALSSGGGVKPTRQNIGSWLVDTFNVNCSHEEAS